MTFDESSSYDLLVTKKFPLKADLIYVIVPILAVALVASLIYYHYQKLALQVFQTNKRVEMQLADLKTSKVAFLAFQKKLAEYGEKGVEIESVASQAAVISKLIGQQEFDEAGEQTASLSAALDQFLVKKQEEDKKKTEAAKVELETKLGNYRHLGVKTEEIENQLPEISDLVAEKNFQGAQDLIVSLDQKLDELMVAKKEADRKAAEAARRKAEEKASSQINEHSNYQSLTVNTDRGSFFIHLVKINWTNPNLRIVTDTANPSECGDNCSVKSLSSYYSQNGGFAAINGSYFCPADYSWCGGKLGAFDTPIYNSRNGKLLHSDKLFWDNRAMYVFDGSNRPHFFAQAKDYNGVGMRAAIANFPGLVSGGQNIVFNYPMDEKQRNVKGRRSGIGASGNTIFLVVASGATVPDLASIFIALGAENALNLDGGGSSSMMYNGAYKVGPGRNLPNAIIFSQ